MPAGEVGTERIGGILVRKKMTARGGKDKKHVNAAHRASGEGGKDGEFIPIFENDDPMEHMAGDNKTMTFKMYIKKN